MGFTPRTTTFCFRVVSPFLLLSFPILYHFTILKNSDLIFLQCYLNVVDRVLSGVDRHYPGVDFVAMRLVNLLHFVEGKMNKRKEKNSQPQYGFCVTASFVAVGSWSHFGSHMWPYPVTYPVIV